jgi:hypothetical protein
VVGIDLSGRTAIITGAGQGLGQMEFRPRVHSPRSMDLAIFGECEGKA